MKHIILLAMIIAFMSFLQAQNLFIVNSNSQTLSRVNAQSFSTDNAFAQIGMYGNHIAHSEGKLYVVNSGDHTIQIVDAQSGATLGNIPVGDFSNPWHIQIKDGYAYTTGMFTDTLYRINLNNHTDISSLPVGAAPTAMLLSGDTMYVSLTGGYPLYEPSRIAVVDLITFEVINYFEVPTNPSEMLLDNRGYLHIVCTGNYADKTTIVAIVDTSSGEVVHTIPLPQSFFVSMQYGPDGLVYVGNGLGLGFVVYDPFSFEVIHDAPNALFAGGQVLLYDSEYIYVLIPDYFSPSKLDVYTYNHTPVRTITLGIGSLAMCWDIAPTTAESDIVQPVAMDVIAYPNPFTSAVRIDTRGQQRGVMIEIYNAKGQKVISVTSNDWVWNGRDESERPVPSGVYFIKVSDDKDVVVRKVLKLRE